jgi:hypothetical protein
MLAELAGIGLVVIETRSASRALERWRERTGPLEGPGAFQRMIMPPHLRQPEDDRVLEHLLGSQVNRRAAVVLLVTGVVIGSVGNFLSLSW